VVAYSDGERVDLGPVVGRDGVGIAGVDGSTGRLVVTLTNGTTVDAGPLPRGPAGAQGDTGPTGPAGDPAPSVRSVTRTFDDGTVERCTRSGGSDVDPELTCSTTEPREETPPPTTGAGPVPSLLGGG
jgi:hypothetical protein